MKRFSQTLKVGMALFLAVFSNGLLPAAQAYAFDGPTEVDGSSVVSVVEGQNEIVEDNSTDVAQEDSETPAQPERADLVTEEENDEVESADVQLPELPKAPVLERGSEVQALAQDKKPEKEGKVTICHRTASRSNPYVVIEVPESAVDGVASNSGTTPDHYGEHKGPLFSSDLPKHTEWGDIIPPVAEYHMGLNWSKTGRAIYENDCVVPVEVMVSAGPCIVGERTSYITIDISGSVKKADKIVLKDSEGTEIDSWNIKVNKDGEVTEPTLPLVVENLPIGHYTVEVKDGKKVLASDTVSLVECASAPSTVEYLLTPCVANTNSTDLLKVSVTNTADDTDESVEYTITVKPLIGANIIKSVTVVDGETGIVDFANLAAGTYTVEISATDETEFAPETIVIGQCTVTPGSGDGSTLGDSTVVKTPTVLPTVIPATGADGNQNPLVILLAAVTAYGATFYLQNRRKLSADEA
ncbi:hypothetical protein EOL73_02025 [Candidatus Saccharibacteria bacterium]|nr:hypothetical protein [Candidatus Saccharibacteria bacterium]